jgi:dTDP-4-amino-4,6-dideoxygalactose transaminase
VATVNAIEHVGAKPVLADVEPDTLNLDPERVAAAITPATRAVLPVHYAGHPVDLDAFAALAEPAGLHIIEDAAHAVSARYKGRLIGSSDNPTAFSFYATKNMTTAEGGMLTTNSDEINQWLRRARFFGINRHGLLKEPQHPDWPYTVEFPGWKSNASEFQAALGLVQLPKLEALNARRRAIADYYNQRFGYRWTGLHLYPAFVDNREEFLRRMQTAGIQCSVHYIPLHWMPAFQGCEAAELPNTEWLGKHLVTIPMYADLSDIDVEYVADSAARYTRLLAAAA